MNTSRTFTIETRLNQKDNAELIEYAREHNILYGKVLRYTWHRYNNGGKFQGKGRKEFNTHLQHQFGISKRFANSIIAEVRGLYHALSELKWHEYEQLKGKIKKQTKEINKLSKKIHALKGQAEKNTLSPSSLRYYRKLKARIVSTKQKANRLKQKRANLLKEIQSKDLHICFGTKKLFYAQFHLKENNFTSHLVWLKHFRQKRDNRSLYVGDKGEKFCNQVLQLTPVEDEFNIQLRKNTKEKQYVYGVCSFSYMKEIIREIIGTQSHGITYRIVFRGSKCYLQAMITVRKDTDIYQTKSSGGAIGLDYNDGFIELAETDRLGNLIHLQHFDLKFHGTGKAAENEIRNTTKEIVQYALDRGKDIVIENLNFKKSKSETDEAVSDSGKKYNRMIHAFDYSRYKKTFDSCCFRLNATLILVHPAYTSLIAEQKYCGGKKLNRHQGAAYVIARLGQGFKDKYIKPQKQETKKSA